MPNIEKNTSIQYEVHLEANEQNTICGSLQNKIVLPENTQSVLSYEEKASKTECLIASACGIITGLLDVFWVGEFSFYDAQTLGREQINDIVINIAASQGCTKKSLEDSIRYLEKKYANPSDKLTNEFGGGLQHHLRDFSHHTSPVGLICSILVQFTGHGYGTDTTGTLVYPVIPEGALIGQTFEEKILYGVLYWVFHLVSDMAGSSNNPGAGTGIPGPLLSLLKEISVLPIFKDKTISLNEKEITFSQWTSKLFNGTALHNTSDKSSIRFDLRTEIGIAYFGIKQSIPVIVNQCVVRAFYFINRLYHELKDKNICTFKDLIKIEPGRVLPFNNRCLTRMITVSSGTFSAIDAIDAAIRSKLSSGCDATNFATGFFMRINFIGIASFAIAIKNDVKNIYIDLKDSILGRESENHFLNFIETQAIDIDADMDNTAIYRHRFDELLQFVKRCRKNNDVSRANHPKERHFVFEIKTQEFDDYSKMVSLIENYTMSTIEQTIITVFEQNYIAYEEPKKVDKWKRHFSFIQTERGRRIGYRLAYDRPKEGLTAAYKDYREKTDVDEVRFILPLNPGSKNDKYISMLNECSETNCDSFFRFIYLRDFFDYHIKKGEYEIFKDYVDDFSAKAKNIIAYKTVVIPTALEIQSFKNRKAEMLRNYNYETLLPNDLFSKQKEILKRNYIERETYKALLGDTAFSDSFITSEWNYDVNTATGVLDQTGVIAGYLKSIEQLLYAVIRLSINKNKSICLKNGEKGEFNSENEEYVNSTLGSLTYFIRENGDILDVNSYVKKYIVDTLFKWIDDERNGHFHKENLYDSAKVDEIRKQTLLLYYLILGGFTITDEQFAEIGILSQPEEQADDEDCLYHKFKMWATPVILYDIPKDAAEIKFEILPFEEFHENKWTIMLQAAKKSTRTDYGCSMSMVFSTSIMANNFCWVNPLNFEDTREQIIGFVKKLMMEETQVAKKMKSISKIIIGSFEMYKTIENKN